MGMELQFRILPCPQHRKWDIPRGICRSPHSEAAQTVPWDHTLGSSVEGGGAPGPVLRFGGSGAG